MKDARSHLSVGFRRFGRGFSFIEILFAMMLLGIGFILVAAMIPVAAVENMETLDQTIGAQIAKGAAEVVETLADADVLTGTSYTDSYSFIGYGYDRPRVSVIGDPLNADSNLPGATDPSRKLRAWEMIKGRMIHAADPRYAWTAVYSRAKTFEQAGNINAFNSMPYAQVHILVTRVRNRAAYTMDDVRGDRPNLRMREVMVYLTEGTDYTTGKVGPDIIEFLQPGSGLYKNLNTPSAVGPGAFVIISDDQQNDPMIKSSPTSTTTFKPRGLGNGRVYRVGIQRPDLGPNKWELAPGYDMVSGKESGGPGPDLTMYTDDDNQNMPIQAGKFKIPARALIMGRASVDPSDATQFEGPVQDVALFTTYVPVR